MRIHVSPQTNSIVVHDQELMAKFKAETSKPHTEEFMQSYMRNELMAALRKTGKQ